MPQSFLYELFSLSISDDLLGNRVQEQKCEERDVNTMWIIEMTSLSQHGSAKD